MTKFKVNVHPPRKIEQKYATLTVNVKEIETVSQAEEIKERLDSIMPDIIRDSTGQKQLTPQAVKNHELVKEKVTKKSKKADKDIGA